MKRILRQVIRGCGDLPHVGSHPGTAMVIGLTLITGIAGAQRGGMVGFLVGSVLAAAVYGPLYLWGAYDRANISDRISKRQPPN